MDVEKEPLVENPPSYPVKNAALDILPPPPLTEDSVYQPFSGSILCDKKANEEQGTTVLLNSEVNYLRNRIFEPPVFSCIICSIVSTLFCCLPLGLVALIYSFKAYNEYKAGQYSSAMSSFRVAKTLNLIGVVLGILFYILILISVIGQLATVDAGFCSRYHC